MVFEPLVEKTTLQLPVPLVNVSVQLVSAPVMATVPVGVDPAPATVTATLTDWYGADGSGVSTMVIVVVEPWITVWFVEPELPA